ncbi:hypothetical protein [Aeromonas veronii]|uniref:hypothetical protein n=1 Tax=Aeromonas veronii TaxID=654 RepID=UPI000DCFABA7|nr:hypothetical protein [Aeromonas veronii]
MPPPDTTLLLEIGEQRSQVWLGHADAPLASWTLAFGTHAIQPGPFRNAPPTPLELERAIMVVEDELMRIAPQIPPGLQLTLRSQPSLAEVLGDNQLDRDLVEQAFGQLAAMAEGDPLAASLLPRDEHFAAVLLIVREWLHHLASESVLIVE